MTNRGARPEGWVNPNKGRRTGKARPLADRFWPKVDKRGPNECWVWKGAITSRNYGQMFISQLNGYMERRQAHRVSWQLAGNELPNYPLVLDHICKNTRCVNPAHLRVVTQEANCMELARDNPFHLNRLKTHCKHGHEFTPENTAWVKGRVGRAVRACLTCYPHQWRYAEVPRERPPGSRIRPDDKDYQQLHRQFSGPKETER